MKIDPVVFWVLLSAACCLGFLLASWLTVGRLSELEDALSEARRDLAVATGHPSARHLKAVR